MFKTTKPPRPITSFPLHQRSCHISPNSRILRKGKAVVRAYPHHFYPTIMTFGVFLWLFLLK